MEYHDADGGDAAQCVERVIEAPGRHSRRSHHLHADADDLDCSDGAMSCLLPKLSIRAISRRMKKVLQP